MNTQYSGTARYSATAMARVRESATARYSGCQSDKRVRERQTTKRARDPDDKPESRDDKRKTSLPKTTKPESKDDKPESKDDKDVTDEQPQKKIKRKHTKATHVKKTQNIKPRSARQLQRMFDPKAVPRRPRGAISTSSSYYTSNLDVTSSDDS